MGVVVKLEEVKLYLRMEGDDEDTLITSLIHTAEEMCEGIIRYPLAEIDVIPETLKLAIYYGVACFYEEREEVNMEEVLGFMKQMLFAYRKEMW